MDFSSLGHLFWTSWLWTPHRKNTISHCIRISGHQGKGQEASPWILPEAHPLGSVQWKTGKLRFLPACLCFGITVASHFWGACFHGGSKCQWLWAVWLYILNSLTSASRLSGFFFPNHLPYAGNYKHLSSRWLSAIVELTNWWPTCPKIEHLNFGSNWEGEKSIILLMRKHLGGQSWMRISVYGLWNFDDMHCESIWGYSCTERVQLVLSVRFVTICDYQSLQPCLLKALDFHSAR